MVLQPLIRARRGVRRQLTRLIRAWEAEIRARARRRPIWEDTVLYESFAGNGALEALATEGLFIEPTLADLERSTAAALEHIRGHGSSLRVFADLWNLDRFASCLHCLDARRARLTKMNLEQRVHPPVACAHCGGAS